MRKKLGAGLLIVVLMLTFVLVPVAHAAGPVPQLLDRVDIGNPSSEATHNVDFPDWGIIIAPPPDGSWGGLGNEIPPGTARVVWESFGGDPAPRDAHLTLDTGGVKARRIKIRVMEGYADDSFDVYIKNPAGKWAMAYSYVTVPKLVEIWNIHDINGFPAGKGKNLSTTIEVKIEATGGGTFPTGRLAVDWVELWDR